MKEFKYIIQDQQGIHARPAGILVKKAAEYSSSITIRRGSNCVDCKRILAVMGLGVKSGEEVVITAEGDDENIAIEMLKKFLNENL